MYNQKFINKIKENDIYSALTVILSKNDEIRVRIEGTKYEEIVKPNDDLNKIDNIIHRLECMYYHGTVYDTYNILYYVPISNIIIRSESIDIPTLPKSDNEIKFVDYNNDILLKIYNNNRIIYNKSLPKYKTLQTDESNNRIEIGTFAGLEKSKQ